MSFILQSSDALELIGNFGGQRARRLAELTRGDLPVPAWFCVTSSAMERFLRGNMLLEFLAQVGIEISSQPRPTEARLEELAQEIEKRILGSSVSPEVAKAIHVECSRLQLGGTFSLVASPLYDYSVHAAPFVNQPSQVALLVALRKLWASAMSAPAVTERLERRSPVWPVSIGVTVSKSVRAKASGIAYELAAAADANGDSGSKVVIVESVWGSSALGRETHDRFIVQVETGAVTPQPVEKTFAYRPAPDGGLERMPVAIVDRARVTLTPPEALAVAELAVDARELLGFSGQLEWAIDDERLHSLDFAPRAAPGAAAQKVN